MRIFITFFCFLFYFSFGYGANLSLIRDTETEELLLDYVRKAFKASGLPAENANVIIINDSSINAFVAGGQTIFVNTGLILESVHPDDLMFVLSHETGHIKGGHVVRGQSVYQKAQTTALISSVLGGLLAVLAQSSDAGLAVMLGANSSAMNVFSHYQQTEESSADRTAVDIMQKTNYSLTGFSSLMKKIQAQERLNPYSSSSYLRTHPFTQDRLSDLQRFLTKPLPITEDIRFTRVKAKLMGFLSPPLQTLSVYQGNTFSDKYARSIALYRGNKIPQALGILSSLIEENPQDGYLYELMGQFLFETGDLEKASSFYGKAVSLKPGSNLIKLAYVQTLLEKGDVQDLNTSLNLLKTVLQKEPELLEAWRLMATAYDRQGNKGLAQYAMVEYYYHMGEFIKAQQLAKSALQLLPPSEGKARQKLSDILKVAPRNL